MLDETAMEMAIDGSTAKEGSMATATAKKSTVWKGLTAMVMARRLMEGSKATAMV